MRVRLQVAELDALPEDAAAGLLRSCCGASRWVSAMLAQRPFGSREALLRSAERSWNALGPADWLEAFQHHPRIGEAQAAVTPTAQSARWSAGEQAGIAGADPALRTELARLNREYEARFGYIYLVAAAGKSAEQLVATVRSRLQNPPEAELATAAREQARITRSRLEQLLA